MVKTGIVIQTYNFLKFKSKTNKNKIFFNFIEIKSQSYIAKKKKPTIISSGMCTYSELVKTQKIANCPI